MSDTELQQLAKTNRNPVQESRYQQLLAGGGGGGNNGASMADQLIKASLDAYTKAANDYAAKSAAFDAQNPFNFDKMLEDATAQVKNRLDPYYSQTLSDYLTGVNAQKARGAQDTNTLLGQLSADASSYTGNAKMALDSAIEKSSQGAADAGLYGSGTQQRDTGTAIANNNTNLSDYMRGNTDKVNSAVTAQDRNTQDLNLQTSQKQRDLGTQESADVTSQASTQAQQAQAQQQYEKAQFTGPVPGQSPADFSTYTTGLLTKYG